MTKTIFFLMAALILSSCGSTSKPGLPSAEEIHLTWELKGNNPREGYSSAVFVIQNTGKQTLYDVNWKLYFSQMGMGVVEESVTGKVRIRHLNGDLLCISPMEGFLLGPGQKVEIAYNKPGSVIKEVEAPSGIYIVYEIGENGKEEAMDSKDWLIPAYGSGPDPDPENGVGSGYLTREDFVDLLRFAAKNHVEVIPEINFPGHSRAAIFAMEARYERLMGEGREEEAELYRLADPDDQSIYNSAQNYTDNISCVCKEAPFLFFEKVVDELSLMYKDAGLELKVVHTGGDEVPAGSWTGSPICEAFLESQTEIDNPSQLQVYFEGRLLEILSRKNLVMAGWEEIALKKDDNGKWVPNPVFAGKGMVPYVWNSLGDFLDLGNRMANAGYPVVLCNVDNFYIDLAYNHHPAEPGHYWGGFVNTRRAFTFAPFNVFNTTLSDRYRRPFNPEKSFEDMEFLLPGARKNIVGLQGQIWSERVIGIEILEYALLPKMLGLAERAWSGQADWGDIPDRDERTGAINRDWNDFAHTIGYREMPRLDYLFGGFNYRLPAPGAIIQEGRLHANVDFPGLTIRYTTDGSEPCMDSPLYEGPVEVTGTISLRTFDTRGRGSLTTSVRME